MDEMTDFTSDKGFSLTELMVVVALMGMVLASAYSAVQVMAKSGLVTETQTLLAREVSTPQQIIDKVVSQNKQIYNASPLISDGYTLSVRTPKAPTVTTYQLRVYKAEGQRFTEDIYDQATLQSTPVYQRTIVWSTHNANRARGIPVFTYYASGVETAPPQARSVTVNLVAKSTDGKYVSSTRQIFFRNR